MSSAELTNIATIEGLVAAYNEAAAEGLTPEETLGATLDVFDRFYSDDLDWSEAPTSFYPTGRRGGRAELRTAAELVSSLLGLRRYTLRNIVASGDRVAAEYLWEAQYREGAATVRIEMATFYRLRDGKVTEIHEYPCPVSDAGSD